MKIKLSPLQEIYNNISKSLDVHEKNLVLICEAIKNRIFSIISNSQNYILNEEVEKVNGKKVLKTIKGLIYSVDSESDPNFMMGFDFDAVIRLLFLDEVSDKDRFDNYILQRVFIIQRQPFMCLQDCYKEELDILLRLWIMSIKHAENEPLERVSSELLPSRNGIDSAKRLRYGKGIVDEDWVRVAC